MPNEQFAYLAQRVVEHVCVALARDAVRLTGLPRARAGRRRRVEREGDAAHPAAAGSRGRLRLSAHGRRRARARGGGRRGRGEPGEPIDARSRPASTSGPGTTTPAIEGGAASRRASRPSRAPNLAVRVADLLDDGRDRDVVPGAHGVRTASARPPQRAGAARPAGPARSAESGAQAARLVSAVLPEHARERRRRGCSPTGPAAATVR